MVAPIYLKMFVDVLLYFIVSSMAVLRTRVPLFRFKRTSRAYVSLER